MTTYTSKPVKVDAVRYDAPVTADDEGNIVDLAAFGAEGMALLEQSPWNPADGQSCLLVSLPASEELDRVETFVGLLKPGDYLVKNAQGAVYVQDGDEFEAVFDVPDEPADPDLSKPE